MVELRGLAKLTDQYYNGHSNFGFIPVLEQYGDANEGR